MTETRKDGLLSFLANKFLGWDVPKSVVSDLCMTDSNYKFPRSGTCIMRPDEARQMLEYLLRGEAQERVAAIARAEGNHFYATENDRSTFRDGAQFAMLVLLRDAPGEKS